MEKAVRVGKILILEAVLSLLCLCLFALILQKLQPSEQTVRTGIRLVYVLVNLMGGILIGKVMNQRKFLWGIITGLLYFVVLSLLSFAIHGGFYVSPEHAVTICLLCVAGGMAGGMLG